MTEAQYITLILGFVVTNATALVSLMIYTSRLSDTKAALKAEIESSAAQIEDRIGGSWEAILSRMAIYHGAIISKIAELDNRITRLER